MELELIKVMIIHSILLEKLKLLASNREYRTKINNIDKHYKNLLALVASMTDTELSKTALLIDRYLRNIDAIREYYSRREIEYIELHHILKKALVEESNILRIQGAFSVLSRLLFLTAVVNPIIHIEPDLTKYIFKINSILSMPVPPKASDAKVLDLLKSGDSVTVVTGSIYSVWVLQVLIDEMLNMGIKPDVLICSQEYELNISSKNYMRYFREYIDRKIVKIYDCLTRITELYDLTDTITIILNNLVLYKILDTIRHYRGSDNILLAFNPLNTPLQLVFGSTPLVISVSTLKKMLIGEGTKEM